MKKHWSLLVASTLILGALTGCDDEGSTAPTPGTDSHNISMSISTRSSLGKGTNAVEIQSAKILLKNIAFHRFPSDNDVDVKVGPFVVTLDPSGSVNTVAVSNIPAGIYDRVAFRLHKPEDSEPVPDAEFREGESGDQRYSVILSGTFNGQAFVYKSRQNGKQEIPLAPPISVDEKGTTNVTLTVDVNSWFVRDGQPLDPTDDQNAQAIDDNIKASFATIFKDDNKDGRPD